MIETATFPDGSPVSTIVLHRVSTKLDPEPGVRSQKLRTHMHPEFCFQPGRRNLFQLAAAATSIAAFGGVDLLAGAQQGARAGHSRRRLRAACSNIGLQVSWCAQGGKRPPSTGAGCSTSTSPGSIPRCRPRNSWRLVEEIASEKWDFVAIQAVDINTITEPVVRMIAAGIPVIDMDTLIAPLDQIDVLTFLAPDNDFMGAAVTQALVDAIGGEGTIIMTQGALGHTGAQGRARGFQSVIDRFPGVAVLATDPARGAGLAKTAQLWETLPQHVPEDRCRVLPQRRHGARRGQRHESAQAYRDPDWRRGRDAAGHPGGGRRPHARHGPQFLLPHPRRRHRRRRRRCARAEDRPPDPKADRHRRPDRRQDERHGDAVDGDEREQRRPCDISFSWLLAYMPENSGTIVKVAGTTLTLAAVVRPQQVPAP